MACLVEGHCFLLLHKALSYPFCPCNYPLNCLFKIEIIDGLFASPNGNYSRLVNYILYVCRGKAWCQLCQPSRGLQKSLILIQNYFLQIIGSDFFPFLKAGEMEVYDLV